MYFFNFPRKLLRNPAVIFYVIYNNFFYAPLSFVFHRQNDCYSILDDSGTFYLFLLQKEFDIFHETFFAFCFFLLQKDFDTFHEPLSEAFLCFSDSIRQ